MTDSLNYAPPESRLPVLLAGVSVAVALIALGLEVSLLAGKFGSISFAAAQLASLAVIVLVLLGVVTSVTAMSARGTARTVGVVGIVLSLLAGAGLTALLLIAHGYLLRIGA